MCLKMVTQLFIEIYFVKGVASEINFNKVLKGSIERNLKPLYYIEELNLNFKRKLNKFIRISIMKTESL